VLFTFRGIARDRRLLFIPFSRLRITYVAAVFLTVALQLPVTASAFPGPDYRGTLRVGGTGAAIATITQEAAAFQKKYPDVRFVFPPSLGSSGGIKGLMAGALDVALSSRPLSEAERGHGLLQTYYARTPLLLVTSYKGAEVSFTLKHIAALYNAEIQSYPDGTPLRIIMRPEIEIDILQVKGLTPEIDAAIHRAELREGMTVAVNDQDNAKTLMKTKGALGWMTMAQLLSEDLDLAPVPIGTIPLNRENFASGAYPLFRSFSVVTGAQPTPLVKAFVAFLSSSEGRAILERNGHFIDVKQP
jgi:phosphate transport system substrate-binding protein